MKIDIIVVGKLQTQYLREGAADYQSRLARFCHLRIVEIPEKREGFERESRALWERLEPASYSFGLSPQGAELDSPALAQKFEKLQVNGHSHFSFLVGGSEGINRSVLSDCKEVLSFSRLTFPHQLFRLLLLEQLYRCCKIRAGLNKCL